MFSTEISKVPPGETLRWEVKMGQGTRQEAGTLITPWPFSTFCPSGTGQGRRNLVPTWGWNVAGAEPWPQTVLHTPPQLWPHCFSWGWGQGRLSMHSLMGARLGQGSQDSQVHIPAKVTLDSKSPSSTHLTNRLRILLSSIFRDPWREFLYLG